MAELTQEDRERIRPLAANEAQKLLQQEVFRKRTLEIINEHAGSVSFMNLVRQYAAYEIDSRMFRSVRYWGTVVITAIIASLIGFFISKI